MPSIYRHRRAGFGIRLLAFLVDCAIFGAPTMPLDAWAVKNGYISIFALTTILGFLYKPMMEYWFGSTLGKMVCKLQVMRLDEGRIALGQAFLRYLPFAFGELIPLVIITLRDLYPEMMVLLEKNIWFMIADKIFVFLVPLIDCGWVLMGDSNLALHDILAKTKCVYRD